MPFQKKSLYLRQNFLFQSGTGLPAMATSATQTTVDDEAAFPSSSSSSSSSALPLRLPLVSSAVEGDSNYKLRSKSENKGKLCGEMRLLHLNKNINMWNEAISDHFCSSKQCPKRQSPEFEVYSEQKRGICVLQSLKCKYCTFVSKTHKLFEEVERKEGERGQLSAVPNVNFAAETLNSAIGPTAAQNFLSALDIPVIAYGNFRKVFSKVAEKVEKLASDDMKEKLVSVSQNSGGEIDISMDTRYNSSGIRNSRRTGLSTTTQCTTTAIERNSGYIVAASTQNKCCAKGSLLRAKGESVYCPNGHQGQCSASLNRLDYLSERLGGEEIGKTISATGIRVRYATTDGDSKLFHGVESAMKEAFPTKTTTRLADRVHYSQAQLKRSKKNLKFSKSLFPGVVLSKQHQEHSDALFTDIKNRSSLALKFISKKYRANTSQMKKAMPKVVDCIVRCYNGDCSLCSEFSAGTCQGLSNKNWFFRSHSLAGPKITSLHATSDDLKTIRSTLLLTLDDKSIELTKGLTHTQLNECANRVISASNPKNVTYSKCVKGKIGASILRWDNGPGTAMNKTSKALGLPTSRGQKNHRQRLDNRAVYMHKYKKAPKTQKRQHNICVQLRKAKWDKKRELEREKKSAGDYRKSQLDIPDDIPDTPMEPLRKSARLEDHQYAFQ